MVAAESFVKPLGITMGCPVGVGPEIILRFFAASVSNHAGPAVVLGDIGVLQRCARQLDIDISIEEWSPGQDVPLGGIAVLALSNLDENDCRWGSPNRQTGLAMARYIEEAVRLSSEGALAGMVTCPIAKSALKEAGYGFPGHTEMLAELTSCDDYAMMLAGDRLRVTLVTIHCPLDEVSSRLSVAAVERLIKITGMALQNDFGIPSPRTAVAGFNPHAGEGGMFGDEEERIIAPAVINARGEGWRVEGPFPPDTVFFKAASGDYDAVVCMYHDQGLIPFKLLHFADGVNVTLGLPIVRTSVDHGTAYDIAGKGVASHASLEAAVRMAMDIAANRQKAAGQG